MAHDPVIMEQIAMFMVALPCPPIPVLVNASKMAKQLSNQPINNDDDDDEENNHRITVSSHDLIAGLLISAMQRNNRHRNEERKQIQTVLTENFINKIKDLGVKQDIKDTHTANLIVEAFYQACMEFTADYIYSFDDKGNPSKHIDFMSMNLVEIGDPVHKACCAWNNGQNILFLKKWFKSNDHDSEENKRIHEEEEKRIQDFKKQYVSMSYAKLLQSHCERVADMNCRAVHNKDSSS